MLDPRSSSTVTCAPPPELGFHEAPGCLVRTFEVDTWSQNSLGEVRTTVEEKKTPHLISQESVRSWPGPRGGNVSLPGGVTPNFYIERDIQESAGSTCVPPSKPTVAHIPHFMLNIWKYQMACIHCEHR